MKKQEMQVRPVAGMVCIAAVVFVAGCASQPAEKPGIVIEPDVARIITLPDGSTCTEPVGLSETRELPGAQQVKALFAEQIPADEALKKAKELKVTAAEAEAAYFDHCRAYFNKEVQKDAFDRNRTLYLELRQGALAAAIKAWADKPDGIKDAGKICLVTFGSDQSGKRDFTRWVPPDTTVDDCALLASRAGAAEVLLGCTEGNWKNTWAKKTVAAGPLGARSRGLVVRDTPAAPAENCGW